MVEPVVAVPAPMVPATEAHLREDEEQRLPRLYASMAIEGLPPFHQTEHLDEAEAELAKLKFAARWNIPSVEDYCRVSLFTASVGNNRVISARRLVDISLHYVLLFMVDDLLFDAPDDDLLEGMALIGANVRVWKDSRHVSTGWRGSSVSRIRLSTRPRFESIMWELGHGFRQLCTPDWFRHFAKTLVEYFQVSIPSLAHILEGT